MINKDRIFNLFSTTPEVKEKEEKRISIEEYIESPYAKIGMFTKLILNHFIFQEKLKKFLKTEEPAYSIENTKEAANYTVFNKAWEYIREIDIENKDHINALIGFNPIVFNKALTSAIDYFQEGEEYEKCAHIFKIQEIVKEI